MASYRKIDCLLRPAKFAERKMLCEMFSRLRPFSPLGKYQYVGFGSIWFADHRLFHTSLGIEKMISIERVGGHESRFEFNRPFGNIDIRIGEANQHLPGRDWSQRTILWLDYDDPLSPGMLDDVRTVAMRAGSGTLLVVSVQAAQISRPTDEDDGEKEVAIATVGAFKERFGEGKTPLDLDARELKGWGVATTTRKMLRSEVGEAVLARNVGVEQKDQMEFRQIGAFEYADNVRMTTIIGVFVDRSEVERLEACGLEELHYYRDGIKALRIEVPKLTPKEMRHLDSLLPGRPAPRKIGAIPPKDAGYYAELYRYLPNYASFEP